MGTFLTERQEEELRGLAIWQDICGYHEFLGDIIAYLHHVFDEPPLLVDVIFYIFERRDVGRGAAYWDKQEREWQQQGMLPSEIRERKEKDIIRVLDLIAPNIFEDAEWGPAFLYGLEDPAMGQRIIDAWYRASGNDPMDEN